MAFYHGSISTHSGAFPKSRIDAAEKGRADAAEKKIDPKEIARLVAQRTQVIDTARAAKIRAARRDHKAGTKAREDAIEAAIHYLDDAEQAANASTEDIVIEALRAMNKGFDPKGLDLQGLLGALKFACSQAGAGSKAGNEQEDDDEDEEAEELEGGEPMVPDSNRGLPDPDAAEQTPGAAEEATRQLRKRSMDAWKIPSPNDAQRGRRATREDEAPNVIQATRDLRQRSESAWRLP